MSGSLKLLFAYNTNPNPMLRHAADEISYAFVWGGVGGGGWGCMTKAEPNLNDGITKISYVKLSSP